MDKGFSAGEKNEFGFGKALALFLGLMLFLLSMSPISPCAGEEQEMPEEIVISNKVYKPDRKGPVWFSHSEHTENYAAACDACHHEYEEGKNVWAEGQPVRKCFTCHDPSKSKGKVKKLNIAFHKSCKGCHKKLAAEGGTDAPYRQCTDCHAKR